MPWWKSIRARVLAGRGELDEAVALADEAAAMEVDLDNLTDQAEKFVDIAEVFDAAGDRPGAEGALGKAIALTRRRATSSRRSAAASGWRGCGRLARLRIARRRPPAIDSVPQRGIPHHRPRLAG